MGKMIRTEENLKYAFWSRETFEFPQYRKKNASGAEVTLETAKECWKYVYTIMNKE